MMQVSREKFVRLRMIALRADAPAFPSLEEVRSGADSAFEFLDDIYYAYLDIIEQGEPDGPFEEGERNFEYAEGAVPYRDYVVANAFSQLALYDYESDLLGFSDSDDILQNMRNIMMDFALNALIYLQESDFVNRQK